MYLVRLVYASKVTDQFNTTDVESILASAQRHNAINNVTGLLCFNSKIFLQCLEGGRRAVNKTYHRILNDPRHSDIVLLDYKEIIKREFAQWQMGYIPSSSLTKPLNMSYSGTPDFDPFEMSGESAHQMMLELRDTIPVI